MHSFDRTLVLYTGRREWRPKEAFDVRMMIIKQFFVPGIAHSSYLVGGADTCAVIDPARDVRRYVDTAKEENLSITHIFETHLHADFLSGHLELAEKTGALIYAPKKGNCTYSHIPVSEGITMDLEDMTFGVMETPGHTPDCVIYPVVDHSRGEEPVAVFTGDTLFVGDNGRPDLFPDQAEDLASRLFDSIHEKVLSLPDHCLVYPAHGAGSLCGRAIGAMRWSTIGYERRYNPACLLNNRQEFIRAVLTDMPAAPDHFSRCTEVNRKGAPSLTFFPEIHGFGPEEFKKELQKINTVVIDTRSYDAFGGQHIPGSYAISTHIALSTYAGWVIPPSARILIVTADEQDVGNISLMLYRVGLDNIIGYLEGGLFTWSMEGLPTAHVPVIDADELEAMLAQGDVRLIDVRDPVEYRADHIEGSLNIPVADLRYRYHELQVADDFICMCASGGRSSLACSILLQQGYTGVYNVAGGLRAYRRAGYSR